MSPFFFAGVALAQGAYAASALVAFGAAAIHPSTIQSSMSASFVSNDISVVNLLAVSVLTPLFEELLLCGYMVTVLKERRGFWTAVTLRA